MKKKFTVGFLVVLLGGLVAVAVAYLHGTNIAVLNPKGPIALQERNLIVFAAALSLIVVIPVFALTAGFAWRYREGNTKAKYSPELDHNRVAETIWWLIPSALILVLSVVAWNSSHQLDPYKPLVSSSGTPLVTIQVVALDWKWLFIYPQQHIATVNFFQIPEQTPVNFEVTADAPMNSFWIPQLGGQIYAMPGMSTQLHLMASVDGSFRGSSANISGTGFAGMNFVAKSSSPADFNQWVRSAQRSTNSLSLDSYHQLAQPSQNNRPATYTATTDLYDTIINSYMLPESQVSGTDGGTSAASVSSGTNMNMPGMGAQ